MADLISIGDELLVTATLLGPVVAVQVQKWVERATEKRNRKLWIFHVLMATRAIRAGSNEHVQALNSIDLFFRGSTKKEKKVRDAWQDYLDFLMQPLVPNMSEVDAKNHNERAMDFLSGLLEALGKALGYDFNKVQLKRGVYYPQGHADDASARANIRDNLVKVLKGEQPIHMAVVHFPVSEEAMNKQKDVQSALLKTLSGEMPLKVKTE